MTSSHSLPFAELTAHQLQSAYSKAALAALVALAFFATISLGGGVYGVLVLGVFFAVFTLSNAQAGLWLSLGLVMIASLIAVPAAFEFGYGYSPELAYWAVATCVVFLALSVGYFRTKMNSTLESSSSCATLAPAAFWGFVAISVFSALLGIIRGYPPQDVAKQFYGCLLFCAYFLFGLAFTRGERDIGKIVYRTTQIGILCALLYIVIYLARVPGEGFRKELTILSAYAGGLAVLFLPHMVNRKRISERLTFGIPMLILFAVPVLAQYKRAILAFAICALLAFGLQSASRNRRYFYTVLAFFVFTIVVSTNLLNPIGAYFAKYESLRMLFPEDIQSSYSVYLRLEELRQVLISLGGVPMFGTGMGSTFVWYDPYSKFWLEQQTMASGWGYLIVKTGVVGTLVFVWLAARIIRSSLARPLRGVHLGMFLLFIFQLLQMVADPFFLNFMTSLWAGMTCGFLCVLNACPAERRVTA